jgi:hypothetical protein
VIALGGRFRLVFRRQVCCSGHLERDDAVQLSVAGFVDNRHTAAVNFAEQLNQFGVNWNPFWSRELPFPVRRARALARLGYSWYSIAVRVILIGQVAYSLWRRVRGG